MNFKYIFITVTKILRIYSINVFFNVLDQEKMLRDNIERMYDETEPWR